MFKFLLAVAALLVVCQGASVQVKPSRHGRIIGGSQARIEEVPYVVALMYDALNIGRYSLICSGAILTETLVVTSARCVDKTKPTQWVIHAGSAATTIEGQYLEVDTIVVHELFDENWANDIALLTVATPFQMDGIKTAVVKIPDADLSIEDGTTLLIAGWGAVEEGEAATGYLKSIELDVVNLEQCRSLYTEYKPVTDSMICAGDMTGKEGLCDGDNGAPMVLDGVLVGIASWSNGCALADQPTVGTKVADMVEWILTHLPPTQ